MLSATPEMNAGIWRSSSSSSLYNSRVEHSVIVDSVMCNQPLTTGAKEQDKPQRLSQISWRERRQPNFDSSNGPAQQGAKQVKESGKPARTRWEFVANSAWSDGALDEAVQIQRLSANLAQCEVSDTGTLSMFEADMQRQIDEISSQIDETKQEKAKYELQSQSDSSKLAELQRKHPDLANQQAQIDELADMQRQSMILDDHLHMMEERERRGNVRELEAQALIAKLQFALDQAQTKAETIKGQVDCVQAAHNHLKEEFKEKLAEKGVLNGQLLLQRNPNDTLHLCRKSREILETQHLQIQQTEQDLKALLHAQQAEIERKTASLRHVHELEALDTLRKKTILGRVIRQMVNSTIAAAFFTWRDVCYHVDLEDE